MTTESEILNQADEMSAMLPWYVTGRLDDTDKARVEAYAQANPLFANEIALAREEADVVFAGNQDIPVPGGALERLRNSVGPQKDNGVLSVWHGLVDRIGGFLADLGPRQLAYAGMAAALAIAIQATSIGALISSAPDADGYQTASSQDPTSATGIFALVSFKPDAKANDIAALFTETGFRIVDGPRAGGLYRVRLGASTMSSADIETAMEQLSGRSDLIGSVIRANATP